MLVFYVKSPEKKILKNAMSVDIIINFLFAPHPFPTGNYTVFKDDFDTAFGRKFTTLIYILQVTCR
jgi:hypothetical protein